MPTTRKRKSRNRSAVVLTDKAVEAFRQGDALALNQELALRPWWPGPLDTDEDDPPEWAQGSPYGEAWPEVRQIRLALEGAADA